MVSPRPARVRCSTSRSQVEGLKSDHFSCPKDPSLRVCPEAMSQLLAWARLCQNSLPWPMCWSRAVSIPATGAISRAMPGGYTDLHLFLQPLPLSLVAGDQGGQRHLGEGASRSCQPPDSRPAPDPRVSERGSFPKALDMRSLKVLATAASSPSSPDSHSSLPVCGANSGT